MTKLTNTRVYIYPLFLFLSKGCNRGAILVCSQISDFGQKAIKHGANKWALGAMVARGPPTAAKL